MSEDTRFGACLWIAITFALIAALLVVFGGRIAAWVDNNGEFLLIVLAIALIYVVFAGRRA